MKTVRNLAVLGIGLSISTIVGWLLLKERKRDKELATVTVGSQSYAPETHESSHIVLPLPSLANDELDQEPTLANLEEDDLTQISDIGPRFASALYAIGITRFNQLADQTPEGLSEALSAFVSVRPQRIRSRDWIGQAAQLAQR